MQGNEHGNVARRAAQESPVFVKEFLWVRSPVRAPRVRIAPLGVLPPEHPDRDVRKLKYYKRIVEGLRKKVANYRMVKKNQVRALRIIRDAVGNHNEEVPEQLLATITAAMANIRL